MNHGILFQFFLFGIKLNERYSQGMFTHCEKLDRVMVYTLYRTNSDPGRNLNDFVVKTGGTVRILVRFRIRLVCKHGFNFVRYRVNVFILFIRQLFIIRKSTFNDISADRTLLFKTKFLTTLRRCFTWHVGRSNTYVVS